MVYGNKARALAFTGSNGIVNENCSIVFNEYCNYRSMLESCYDNEERSVLEAKVEILKEVSIKDIGAKIKAAFQKLKEFIIMVFKKIKDFIFKKKEGIKSPTTKAEADKAVAQAKSNTSEVSSKDIKVSIPEYEAVYTKILFGNETKDSKRYKIHELATMLRDTEKECNEMVKDADEIIKKCIDDPKFAYKADGKNISEGSRKLHRTFKITYEKVSDKEYSTSNSSDLNELVGKCQLNTFITFIDDATKMEKTMQKSTDFVYDKFQKVINSDSQEHADALNGLLVGCNAFVGCLSSLTNAMKDAITGAVRVKEHYYSQWKKILPAMG